MKTFVLTFVSLLFFANLQAQKNFWTHSDDSRIAHLEKLERGTNVLKHKVFMLDFEGLKNVLNASISRELGIESELIVMFPNANGTLQPFKIYEASVMHPELDEKHPDIKSYVGIGLDDRTAMIRFSTTIFGFHGMIFSGKTGTTYIDPYTKDRNHYIVYFKKHTQTTKPFECLTETVEAKTPSGTHFSPFNTHEDQLNGSLRKFRLALACTIEYSAFHVNAAGLNSGSLAQKKAAVLAAMNVSMTRINGIYERDLSVTMQLVPNNENIIFITSDNFNNNDSDVLIDQSRTVINSIIGLSNYDIGHTVSTGSGGLAYLGIVCASNKARGVTGSSSPVGDPFDVDYVAHEMGHQFGANHTFNNSCGGNRNSSTAVEPGSGSTIMAYAGICPPNVQENSDVYFHTISLNQIKNNLLNFPCSQNSSNGNTKPTVASVFSRTIPKKTPFVLRGNGSDADGDALTYCWEQTNPQVSTQPPSANSTSGPNFRSLPPSTSPNRYMPALSYVLLGYLSPTWEVLPNVGRTMNFALTVRDNHVGGGEFTRTNMVVTVSGSIGPFVVTSQNSNVNWSANSQQTITWNVAGTTNAPVSTSSVNILLSTNGGASFDYVLASNTPNDGSETITVPNVATTNARIMVEAVDNIFYAVNSSAFSIGDCPTYNNSTSASIPDGVGLDQSGTPLVSMINVTNDYSIINAKATVNINHTWISDLKIVLEHPNGTQVVLWNRNCNNHKNINVTFDQNASSIVCSSPTVGTYRPVGDLSNFDGLSSQGNWKLIITDNYNQDTGSLVSWSLDLGCDTSATEDFGLNNFAVYPNPSNGNFTLTFTSQTSEDINVCVFDLRGRKVFDQTSNASKTTQNIALSDVQPGIYLLTVKVGEKSEVRKIVVK